MRKLWIFALAALALVSCVREWTPEEMPPEEGLVERTWTVAMPAGTRATLDANLRPIWEVGEKLSVYDHVAKVGRVFEVKSVDGNTATISGSISAGDFPFDAIYPSKSAGAWSEDGTNKLKLPATQLIPDGRNVCPDVLVSTAHSETLEGTITFHNISSLLKVRIDRDGIADVTLGLIGASETDVQTFKAAAASGTLAQGEYYIAVNPGTYAGGLTVTCSDGFGLQYEKSSTAPLEAAVSGILNLGTVSDGTARYYYKVTAEKTYANLNALLNETGYSTADLGSYASYLRYYFSENMHVKAINFTYRSVDPQGKATDLSARAFIPEPALEHTNALTGIAIANHGTIAANAECPTMKAQFEGAFAWKNYAIVMSDYYGFGVSQSHPQAYLDPETTARGNLDAYFAALQLMKDRQVTIPSTLFNIGYSQGGFNAMANLRYVALHPELGVSFQKTFSGGSPFDVEKTWNAYLAAHYDNAIGFVPLTLVSLNEAQQLGIPYDHIFKGALLQNYSNWILSKNYNLGTIKSKIGTTELSDILTTEMMNGTGTDFEKIITTCRRFSLTSGWVPPASSWIYIYHSKQDDSVPYANYTAMKTYLNSLGSSATIKFEDGNDGGHVDGAVAFILNILLSNYWKP